MLQKIADNSHLMRCTSSNAVINVDSVGFNQYIQSRNKMDIQKDRISSLNERVEFLTSEMEYIKNLLSGYIK